MISDNVKRILCKIEEAAILSGRTLKDITLVGVTKTVTADKAKELMDCGITNLGENRVQSLLEKFDVLGNTPCWHLIGHLQTNKVKYIADKVSMIHSVDSIRLAEEIDKRFGEAKRQAEILIQVNVSGEESKSGITPEEAFSFAESLSQFRNIKVQGLMTMAPICANSDELRKIFYGLHKLAVDISAKKYDNINMGHLSMGMSGDFYEAILEGATLVRIGSALFQ